MPKDLRVTIRLLPDKEKVYEDYKQLVTETLHSDVCYVTTMLMESFTKAVLQAPSPDAPIEMRFLKQNVQINMGCNFNYYTKKARRTIQDKETLDFTKNAVLGNLIEMWPTLKPESQAYWRKVLTEQGIIEAPSVSTRKPESLKRKIFRLLKHCMTFVTGLFGRH